MAEETMSDKLKKRSWYERYRPKTIDEITLPEWQMIKFRDMIANPHNTPNLLFVGPSGSGKTTLAHILIKAWAKDPDDVMVLNGAGIGIDDIRPSKDDPSKGQIYRFAATPPNKSPFKIVYIEELQRASVQDFYKYFRNAVEVLSSNCIFMISTNGISELDGPFVKRFNVYTFDSLPVEYTKEYIRSVLTSENVQHTEDDLDNLIKYYYPSVRDMIQISQQYTLNNVLKLDNEIMGFNGRLVELILFIINTKNINSNEFEELSSLIKANAHLIDLQYIVQNIIYQVDSIRRMRLAKYSASMVNRLIPDVAIFGLLGEVLLDENL